MIAVKDRLKNDKTNKSMKEMEMKTNTTNKAKINIKPIIEKAKTLALVIIITAGVAFYSGVQYQNSKTNEVKHQVKSAVEEIKSQIASKK